MSILGPPPKTGRRSDWETPWPLFSALHDRYHFTIDAAASDRNARLRRYWTPSTDALAQRWEDERVWCNPPYGSHLLRWIEKAWFEVYEIGHCPLVALLAPARTDTDWWHEYGIAVAQRVFVRRRVHFELNGRRNPRGSSRPVFASVVLVFSRALAAADLSIDRDGTWDPAQEVETEQLELQEAVS